MNGESGDEITALLERWRAGETGAADALIGALYPALKQIAQQNVRRFRGSLTLSATELVNEMYERLQPQQHVQWKSREHVIAIATTLMRRAAFDYLRGRRADKRGSGLTPVQLESLLACEEPQADEDRESIDLENALAELAAERPAIAAVAELKLFSGMTKDEVAECCGISSATGVRHWRFARAWLADRLGIVSKNDIGGAHVS